MDVPTPEERHLDTLELFTYRARRVESHSLLHDRVQFVRWAQGTFRVERSADVGDTPGGWWVSQELPAEEPLESLASRCRPFVLEKEKVHYRKVLNALGYFTRDDGELREFVANQREHWDRLDRKVREPLGYMTNVVPLGEPFGEMLNDRELAYQWLYGDLVHADDVRNTATLTVRYQAGAFLVSQIAFRTVALLNASRLARQRGLLELPEDVDTLEVSARGSYTQPANIGLFPPGTSLPDVNAVMDAMPPPPDTDSAADERQG